jgi:hypothetical protein
MLFKLINKAVEGIQQQIMGQLRSMTDDVMSPIDRLISEILSGAWVGDDADAMVNEIRTVVIPMVQELIAAIGGINTGVGRSLDLFHQTDTQAAGKVDDLVGVFSSIF